MPKVFTSEKQKIGKLGEELAKKYLIKHGYTIKEENYTKKYGEIDLVAQKDNITHFIEVKSIVSHETKVNVSRETQNTVIHQKLSGQAHETHQLGGQTYDPMQNIHPGKLKSLSRVIQVYLVTHETVIDWQFDVITVKINEKDRIGTVKHIKDLVL